MIVYDGIKSEFLNSVMNGTIAEEVRQRIFEKMGRTTPKSEFDSWKNSLTRMYLVLSDASIPDHAGIAIEYNVPQTSKRVDFIVSGYDADNQSNAVIIELKQWDELKKSGWKRCTCRNIYRWRTKRSRTSMLPGMVICYVNT